MVVRAGACALESLSASPSLLAYTLLQRVRPPSPLTKGNRKSAVTPTPLVPWAMADCAFSSQRSRSFTSISVRDIEYLNLVWSDLVQEVTPGLRILSSLKVGALGNSYAADFWR